MLLKRLFVYVELNEVHQISFHKEQLEWVKKNLTGVHTIDFDNSSEGLIVEKTIEAVKEADKILILLEQKNTSSEPGPVLKFLNNLIRQKNKTINLIFLGENLLLERMGKALGEASFYHNINYKDQQILLKSFFKE